MPGAILAGQINAKIGEAHISTWRLLSTHDATEQKALFLEIEEAKSEVSDLFEKYQKTIQTDLDKRLFSKLSESRADYIKAREHFMSVALAGRQTEAAGLLTGPVRTTFKAYLAAAEDVVNYNAKTGEAIAQTTGKEVAASIIWISVGSVLALIVCSGFAFALTQRINRTLREVATELSNGSGQTAAASQQVAAASQSLAEGSSQQAAGVEETSSSLEEIASMTRQNAQNASQANDLMRETDAIVQEANSAMVELTGQMKEISTASSETQKIIKTIDEIAFQTNILALNAAVEAARAGEAGAGFAVVADEVRSLAQRAAEASKNTALLIEGSFQKIQHGTKLVQQADAAFAKVAQSAQAASSLVSEIAAASTEQTKGIDQITRSVAEMDKITQQAASNAEESASAAEELSAQAENMVLSVSRLLALVEGRSKQQLPVVQETYHLPPLDTARATPNPVKAAIEAAHPRACFTPIDLTQAATTPTAQNGPKVRR